MAIRMEETEIRVRDLELKSRANSSRVSTSVQGRHFEGSGTKEFRGTWCRPG